MYIYKTTLNNLHGGAAKKCNIVCTCMTLYECMIHFYLRHSTLYNLM